jgi:hypothetical protein
MSTWSIYYFFSFSHSILSRSHLSLSPVIFLSVCFIFKLRQCLHGYKTLKTRKSQGMAEGGTCCHQCCVRPQLCPEGSAGEGVKPHSDTGCPDVSQWKCWNRPATYFFFIFNLDLKFREYFPWLTTCGYHHPFKSFYFLSHLVMFYFFNPLYFHFFPLNSNPLKCIQIMSLNIHLFL